MANSYEDTQGPGGHTRFFPDAGFGMLKCQFRRTKVGCLHDIAEVVRRSAKINHCLLVGNQHGDVIIPTYDWADLDCPKCNKENNSLLVLL